MEEPLKRMMLYQMKDIDWRFEHLTDHEKKIIGDPKNLKKMEEGVMQQAGKFLSEFEIITL